MSYIEELKGVIKGEVEADDVTLEKYSRDASIFAVRPEVVVFPKDSEDIQALVNFVHAKRAQGEHISLTPRSGGTDMSGGPLSSSIVVEVNRHMNHLQELGKDFAVVEPGMFFRDFDKETQKQDLELPSYTASREICTVGGMVGTNAGGEKNLKYGKTARWVRELSVVLRDGNEHVIRPLTQKELEAAKAEDTVLGDIYRKMDALIAAHTDLIARARPKVSKNSSGYALWDVWSEDRSVFDLTKVLTGSQGTLGIFTRIRFGLVKPKRHTAMAVMFLNDLGELGKIVNAVLKHDPESFESYDDHTFELGVKYFPEFLSQMKANLLSLGVQFLPEMLMVMTGGVPKLVLLAEFAADTQDAARRMAEACAHEVHKKFGVQVKVAKDEQAARKYWTIRRESFNLLRKKIRGKRTAPFIDDFVVHPKHLPEFLPRLNAILDEYDITYTVAGHIGDGNFHIIPLVDMNRADIAHMLDELSQRVYDLVIEYEGSISGEHNDGIVRAPYVKQMFGEEMYQLFVEVKRIFDPENIFNPGKKVEVTKEDAFAHLDTGAVHKSEHSHGS